MILDELGVETEFCGVALTGLKVSILLPQSPKSTTRPRGLWGEGRGTVRIILETEPWASGILCVLYE